GLLSLSERFTFAIPSSTVDVPDVSLHDHNRTVAAIAACLHRREVGHYEQRGPSGRNGKSKHQREEGGPAARRGHRRILVFPLFLFHRQRFRRWIGLLLASTLRPGGVDGANARSPSHGGSLPCKCPD
ncbi:MAG TPA: hypothetical protein PKG84_07500, partial [Novosphingobium sp.]|nr:hypothetical protein [Novosphingobium sp.]